MASFLKKVNAADEGEKVFQVSLTRTTMVPKVEEAFVYIKAATETEAKAKAEDFIKGKIDAYDDQSCDSENDLEGLDWEIDPGHRDDGDEEYTYDIESIHKIRE